MRRTNLKHFLIGFPLAFFIGALGLWSFERLDRLRIDLSKRTDYFDYSSIEYVRTDRNSLIFKSTSLVKRDYPIFWNDILRCEDGKDYRVVSVQNTNSETPSVRTTYEAKIWTYSEPFPFGKTCYLDSTISMDVKGIIKRQEILSEPFVIREE